MHAPPADCCYRLATLKYAPQHSGDAGASEGGASMPSSGDMRGAFDQVSIRCGPRLILHILYRVLLYSAACWISLSTPCANGVQLGACLEASFCIWLAVGTGSSTAGGGGGCRGSRGSGPGRSPR